MDGSLDHPAAPSGPPSARAAAPAPDPLTLVRSRAYVSGLVLAPFAGSRYARWIPLDAVRAFAPTDATLTELAVDEEVNARITSVSSRFDPHIPGGSRLAGAINVELATPGHFRALDDPTLVPVILDALSRARREQLTGESSAGAASDEELAQSSPGDDQDAR